MTRHPALSANGSHGTDADDAPERHYVPEGWEELDRGVCPCGELVRWDEAAERWIPDRALRVLVLTEAEAETLRAAAPADLALTVARQLILNESIEDDEPDDGQVLIAGVLYDAETLDEATTCPSGECGHDSYRHGFVDGRDGCTEDDCACTAVPEPTR